MYRLAVRIYMGKKQLSVPSSGVTIDEIEDIPNVSKPEPSGDDEETCTAVTIAGIQQLEANTTCINCKKLIPATSESVCVCENCNTMQKTTNHRYSAKLFMTNNNNERLSLRAYDEALKSIAQTDKNISSQDLLFAPPFDVTFNKYHVITHVSRK